MLLHVWVLQKLIVNAGQQDALAFAYPDGFVESLDLTAGLLYHVGMGRS